MTRLVHPAVLLTLALIACETPRSSREESSRSELMRDLPLLGMSGFTSRDAGDPDSDIESIRIETSVKTTTDVYRTTVTGLSFDADNGGFAEVLKTVQTITAIPIITTPSARAAIQDEGLVLELDITAPLTVANLLDVLTSRSDSLRWSVQDGVVTITTKEDAQDQLALEYYDVRALTFPRTEFIAPRLTGIPTGDDETPRSGAEGEEVLRTFEPDALTEVIRIATDPSYWENEPGASMELAESGTLIVRASPEIHRQIRRVLGQ